MTRAITEEEFVDSASELLQVVGKQTLLLQKNGKSVAAIVSMDEYESTHEAKAERAVAAMMAFREHMQSVATPEELEQLARDIDPKAS